MVRFYYIILCNIILELIFLAIMEYVCRHKERFSMEYRYRINRFIARYIIRFGRIRLDVRGTENLPEKDGYLLVSNHQGKLDALAIIDAHDAPCGIVIDHETAKTVLVSQFVDLTDGIRLDRSDMRQSRNAIRQMAKQVEEGQRILIFPEGGYTDNHNRVGCFKPGAFKGASYAHAAIVPVALVDSWKPFGGSFGLKRIEVKVRFLKPIAYEDYRRMKTAELSEMVRSRIIAAVSAETGEEADLLLQSAEKVG